MMLNITYGHTIDVHADMCSYIPFIWHHAKKKKLFHSFGYRQALQQTNVRVTSEYSLQ